MYLTSIECTEAAELYGPSALSEADMDKFFSTTGGVAIPKKPRKKSKTSTKQVDEGGVGKEVVPNTSAGVEEEEERGSEVPQFVPRPPPVELDPELREFEEGAELQKEKEELEKKNKEMQEVLDEVVPAVKQLEQERASLSTKLVFEESKRKISESEREAQEKEIKLMKEAYMELKKNVQMLVHNGMEEHISNFISSSSFDNIVNLYRLPTAILTFTDSRKKVKAEYPKVDVTKITFGEQEEGVEENCESMSADFRLEIKLRWDHDADGCTVFLPKFDFEFVAVEKEEAEVEEDEVGAGVEGTEVDDSQPAPEVEIHLVPSDDE
ncbi:hypothetical protein SLEP1_g23222 [Rubroshorea leprosula]|uniref:Uncharacterized protein n=1 Tax=Rubroshorea leprosula TaxID=152421 RepID=A0AAV5JHU8_9ROSI|nr:hypothetical protein SLEP1_g23222 [Rubroshorea leprosula]